MGIRTLERILIGLLSITHLAFGVELTFELLDNAKDCFYEDVQVNTSVIVEYQVVTGGSYDVDATVENPRGEIIYRNTKSQFDTYTFIADYSGVYAVCFSNEFSTFSHKMVYMDFQVGDEPRLQGIGEQHLSVMTQMEYSAEEIHKSLNSMNDHQTHHRLRETQGRKRAEDLNERVLWWSLMETVAILTITIAQVLVLKNFFSEKRPAQYGRL